ncbi:MAG: winged helix-turn-helix domain-containing protein [Rhodothermales bacterium]
MKKKFDFYWTQRIIDLLMKLAGVVVTSAATIEVAHTAFGNIDEPWLTVIKVGALILIEGAFIASWLAIDTQHSAPMPMKVAWAITLIVIYIALLIIALNHGEGAAGWAFRAVLLVMILRSIYEAGVYEVLKTQRKEERNIGSSFKVRRVGRQLSKTDAIKALNMESAQANYARELGSEVARAKIEAEHEAALIDVKLMRERLLATVHAKDNLARKKFQAQIAIESKHAQFQLQAAKTNVGKQNGNGSSLLNAHRNSGSSSTGSSNGGGAKSSGASEAAGESGDGSSTSMINGMINANGPKMGNKKDRLKEMLMWALMENPNHSKQALSAHIGASPGTIRRYLEELQDEGKVQSTNKTRSGYTVVEAQ